MVIIGQHRVKARKQHGCFLCSFPIDKGEVHDIWSCVDPGISIVRIRAHDACKEYAHDCINAWTNGDGVDDNAVETDLCDKLTPYNHGDPIAMDEREASRILALYPGLERIVAKIRTRQSDRK